MKVLLRLLFVAAVALASAVGSASAQYMFLDANGDGVNDPSDRLNATGATTVDIWVTTNANADGGGAVCTYFGAPDPTYPLSIFSYTYILHAVGGTVTYGTPTNQQASFTAHIQPLSTNTTDLWDGWGGTVPLDPGTYKLATVSVTVDSGTPSLAVGKTSDLDAFNAFTSFGTECPGNDFDSTYKLGPWAGGDGDWFDSAGLGAPAGVDQAPLVTAPPTAGGPENASLTFTVSASDPDGDAITNLTAAPLPTGATFSKNAANTSGTFSWTPDFTQAGTYNVTFTASNALSGSAATAITITNVDRAPTVTAPLTASGPENALLTFTVSASDLDGDAIALFQAAPLPTGATFSINAARTSGTFSWTPDFTQAGTYNVTFTATNALSGTGTTAITVTNVDRAPTVTAPTTQSGSEGALLTFTVSASDPDGDAITNLTAAPLPTGATFSKNAANTSGTFSWTPTAGQAGTYNVTFTASNALSGTAMTAITISAGDRAPVVTAPATQTVAENALLTFTVSASDPDGQAITSLTAAPLPSGATFTPNGTFTSGTFSWTPSFTQAGSYSVVFTATNALTGSATTNITVTNVDRAPTVTAPPSQSVSTGSLLTFTVTAADPDGDAITSLTAAPLPTGATFTPNGTFTSGTFSWTPTLAQAGTHNVTFTASNALSGSATTLITVASGDAPPVVTAPATQTVAENSLLTFTVSVTDPNGDAIASLTAAPLPSGATFTPNGASTSGTFSWTPDFTQAGTYSVTFTATNALTGTAATAITVTNTDRAPTVSAPATQTIAENSLLSFTVSASDADGDAITSLTAAPLPPGATFTPNGTFTSGTFSWTPSFTQAGTYSVVFTAANALTGSATTAITVTNVDRAPVVTAPPTAGGPEGVPLTFTVSATDPDGDAITSLTAAPLPSGAAFTPDGTNTSGTFSWTPAAGQTGTYSVVFTASNALTGSAMTNITIAQDLAPVVTAPPTASGDENTLITFTVSASDPDGDAITSLTAAPLPPGATFNKNAANTSGTFSWTPDYTQAGTYSVTFTASNSLSGSASTDITVNNVDRAPVVTAPATQSVVEGNLLTFTVSASDPDGDAITNLAAAPLPTGATFTPNGANTSGTFSWTPDLTQAGTYSVVFTATNALSGSATTNITVTDLNNAPVVTAPASQTTDEGVLLTFGVSATDADSDPVALTATGLPFGATFTDNNDNTGTFSWTPNFTQAGTHTVTFNGSDGKGGTGTASTVITVNNVNQCPIADAGGPYTGVVNVALTFNGSGSSDPDGDALTYAWDYGDGNTGTGQNPTHTYTAPSTYTVTLTVSDSQCSDTATTTATILDVFQARAFTVGGNKTLRLGSGRPVWCAQIEPVGGSFDITNVILSSVKMVSPGTGSVTEIFGTGTKTTVDGDKDHNGINEITECFAKDDLRNLFSALPVGRSTVNVTLEGNLITGGRFMATLALDVVASGHALQASALFRQADGASTIGFRTEQPGTVKLRVFDLSGRLVTTLVNEAMPSGQHSVRWDGRAQDGGRVAAGVYFFALDASGAHEVQKVTVLK